MEVDCENKVIANGHVIGYVEFDRDDTLRYHHTREKALATEELYPLAGAVEKYRARLQW